ncbi:MAG TPA: DUF1638 domain-containing protein [Steroidobacteraceae bacterium]|nr:DUF1638 domain-containing protein [Steroidobacteraceae bacterium]
MRTEGIAATVELPARQLIIACGALACEVAALRRVNDWSHVDVVCLPPELHNRPERIAGAVREQIHRHRRDYADIFVAYGECGTRGALDAVLREEGVERIAGAHCYEFYATPAVFSGLADAEPGSFYLTDFLLRHFERLVIRALGIDRHPELLPAYFGNYHRLVYLAQAPKPDSESQAQAIAERLGLEYRFESTRYGGLEQGLAKFAGRPRTVPWRA